MLSISHMTFRNRTSLYDIGCALYLYFLGLSTRSVAKALSFLNIVKRNHISIWKWIQKHQSRIMTLKRKNIYQFIVDETIIRVGSELIWLWVAIIEPENKQILALKISTERNMFVY
jgi:putative transposase